MSRGRPAIVVLGSVNLDLVASVPRLPVPGETVSGATLNRFPGGKGANQALAAQRLGATVSLCARTGDDAFAHEALALLRDGGVDLTRVVADTRAPTGVALIAVAADGENQIVVAPGANRAFLPEELELPAGDALICSLEVPLDTIAAAATRFTGLFCLNIAPAMPVPVAVLERADLVVMNETEAAFVGDAIAACRGFVAVTRGARGATLSHNGKIVATATPPEVKAVDTTGAGDTFTAALSVALIEDQPPESALRFACAAGALATTRHGAQPSLPLRADVDAI